MDEDFQTFTVRLPVRLHTKLKILAASERTSILALVLEAIGNLLAKRTKGRV